MSSNYSDLSKLLGIALNDDVVKGVINLMRNLDDYMDESERKHSDETLVLSAYRLYKQGAIGREEFMGIIALLSNGTNRDYINVTNSLNAIRNRNS